jgi:SAM-dependent methyltransferase
MRQNLNPYNPEQFKKQFESTDICRSVSKDFDNLWWDQKIKFLNHLTPRQLVCDFRSGFSMIPFYYLQPLLEKNPTSIYDLGCGANLFKRYIPNIIGVDKLLDHSIVDKSNSLTYPDIEEMVDLEYVNAHQNYFESVFSINSLHFRPLSELRLVYEEFISMVAPGGRGFLSVNLQRMIEKQTKAIDELVLDGHVNYNYYVRTQLDNLPCKYLTFDVDLNIMDEWLDGNVRLVFER